MTGLSGAALEARDRLVDTSLETNKQTVIVVTYNWIFLYLEKKIKEKSVWNKSFPMEQEFVRCETAIKAKELVFDWIIM